MARTAGCSGEIAVSTTARQGPDVKCSMVWFSAPSRNTGKAYIGFNEDGIITAPDGADGVSCGIELEEKILWGPISIANLNLLDFLGTEESGDSILYIAVR